MSAVGPALESRDSVPVLLVELPSRPEVFLGNIRDLLVRPAGPSLELNSPPGEFWPDVFVNRPLPWNRFLHSAFLHVTAAAILIGISQILALKPRAVPQTQSFDHSQVVYYQASGYLPPLDTRPRAFAKPEKSEPELAQQPIISVPPESDNRTQIIVAPPDIKLKRDIAMPNVVAWSDTQPRPQLAIPAAPVVPASQITRLAPTMDKSVVAPPPDAARMQRSRISPALQSSVVAPPPDVRDSGARSEVRDFQPAPIAPPPMVEDTSPRRLGDINVAPSDVIAPAPQLPVATQRTAAGGMLAGPARTQVVPPPPSIASSAGTTASAGSRGRLIALNLHPAVMPPPESAAGNRRGSFAAEPEGHIGALGSPGGARGTGPGEASAARTTNALPAGLYVGKPDPDATTGASANKLPADSASTGLVASVHSTRVGSSHAAQPETATKLKEAEREVFGDRKFYSLTLNMPNLNSGGGSWVIRFAELNRESDPRVATSPPADLSQPMATRKVDPAYPTQLMRQNVAGTVILYAVIHADGTVGDVRVLRGVDERLDRFAREALAQWKFDPATRNGQPVDVEATFQIPFRPARFASSF